MTFDGTNHYDTGVSLFDEDKDFVLAIDYEFISGCESGGVLAQCYQDNGKNGFKMAYDSNIKLTWGTSTNTLTSINDREMLIIRHIKGDRNLYVYNSNLDYNDMSVFELAGTKDTITTSTLTFGAAQPEKDYYENNAIGNIYWAKIWYTDLGDEVCRKLALWTREKLTLEACGFRRYYLSEDGSKRCSFSLLASHLLSRPKAYSNVSSTAGGWDASTLRTYLNDRFYRAIPDSIRGLLKQVDINASAGNDSTEILTSPCYVAIPSAYELDKNMNSSPYYSEGIAISYMTSNAARIRTYDGGDAYSYWTRSANYSATQHYTKYQITVAPTGVVGGSQGGFKYPTEEHGVLVLLSM